MKTLQAPIVAALITTLPIVASSQSPRAPFEDPAQRFAQTARLRETMRSERQKARVAARLHHFAAEGKTPAGGRFQLQRLRTAGAPPRYHTPLDYDAAVSAATDLLNLPPYTLRGTAIPVGVWDDGSALTTHVEFNQTGSSRILSKDGSPMGFHATAVTGVIVAAGLDSGASGRRAFGAAPMAIAHCYDFLDDLAEVAAAAAAAPDDTGRLFISNHAYGPEHGWQPGDYGHGNGWYWFGTGFPALREDLRFGLYDADSADLDQLAYDAPYWLWFQAAGNDRNQGGPTSGTYYTWNGTAWSAQTHDPATVPHADFFDSGYDTMISVACAKNVIAVGAVTDAVTAGVRNPAAASQAPFSSWGPVDDGRVKPDLVANGTTMRSVSGTGASNYGGPQNGTSFSAPSAAGAALLLVEQTRRSFPGANLRAATLKALLLHTATDLGNPGPDYQNGFGLVDARTAADLIIAQKQTPGAHHIVEGLLSTSNPTDSYTVEWDGVAPLLVTLCWTDPPGAPHAEVLDDPTPALFHDLDLRVTGPSGTVLPYVLNRLSPSAPATTGDNTVDTVEQVRLTGGTPGTYTISVSHKGMLNAPQWYGLVASGQDIPVAVAPLIINTTNPAFGQNGSIVAISINGSNISFGTQLLLRRSGHPDVEAVGEYSSSTTLYGRVDLTSVAAGLWDVVVLRPDGTEAALVEGFEIQDASRVAGWEVVDQ